MDERSVTVDQRERPGRRTPAGQGSASPLGTEVLTGTPEFAALEEEWNDLYAASPSATPFQSWAWLYSWWEHYGHDRLGLRIVTLREKGGGSLVGLAPFMLERGVGPLAKRLRFVGTGEANYLDVIPRAGYEHRVARAVAEALRPLLGYGGVADLGDLRPSAAAWELYRVWKGPRSSAPQDGCPVIDLGDGGWDGLLASLSKNRRNTVRRSLKRAGADGVRGALAGAGEAGGAARTLVELHRESWQGRDIAAEHLTDRWASYVVASAERMTERGLGAVSELRRGEEVLASHLLVYGRESDGFLVVGASKEAMKDYQFSSLLIHDGVVRTLDRGVSCFDMMQGEEPYKMRWATRVVPKHRAIMARGAAPWLPYAGYHVLGASILRRIKQRVKSENTPRWIESAAKVALRRYRVLRRTTTRT